MKKLSVILLSLIVLFICAFNGYTVEITNAPTPAEEASLLFSKKLGSGYKNAPTPLAYQDGCLYVAAGRFLYKLDASSGDTLAKTQMESISTYTAVPPLVIGEYVYIPLDDGIVQAFSTDDLSPVWTYFDPLGGQGLTTIVYSEGFLYTGFWNGETDEANFVCLSASAQGEQDAVWSFSSKGGFYRNTALIHGRFLIIGSDNGERVNLPEASSNIYVLDRFTGNAVSTTTIPGDVRAGIGYDPDSDAFYAVSKAGILCRFFIDDQSGSILEQSYSTLPGSSTITPLVYNGRLYSGCSDGRNGLFLVMDANDLQLIYSAELPGMPQGDFLLSTAYENLYGKVLIYSTYNAIPGGVYVFEDSKNQKQPAYMELFSPPEGMTQYCFCPIIAGEDGTLYYKNDSGNIFALFGEQEKAASRGSVFQRLADFVKRITQFWKLLSGWFRI